MKWYSCQSAEKSVHEVVLAESNPQPVDSKFGMMMFGSKYQMLHQNVWAAGFFRMDGDSGPYLLVRADGYADRLKGQPFRVAFCFYRMRAGGLIALFVDFPKLKLSGVPSEPFVLFEMIRGIDLDDERERINDAISRDQIHICFAEGDGPGEDLGGGMWAGSSINASFDVLIDLEDECREALRKEWQALLEYHDSMPSSRRDFQESIQQMQAENPLSENPILSHASTPPASSVATGSTASVQATNGRATARTVRAFYKDLDSRKRCPAGTPEEHTEAMIRGVATLIWSSVESRDEHHLQEVRDSYQFYKDEVEHDFTQSPHQPHLLSQLDIIHRMLVAAEDIASNRKKRWWKVW